MKVEAGHQKKRVLEDLLSEGMVLVALDARVSGVVVPKHLAQDPQLRLNLSYRFGLPMEVGIEGVTATLTFGGVPHACVFPWRSIFLMVCHGGGQPHLFPDDIPAELGYEPQGELDGVAAATAAEQLSPAESEARPKLSLVREEAPSTEPAPSDTEGRPIGAAEPSAGVSPQAKPVQPAASPRSEKRASRSRKAPKPAPLVGSQEKANSSDDPEEPPPAAPRNRGHLRVVK